VLILSRKIKLAMRNYTSKYKLFLLAGVIPVILLVLFGCYRVELSPPAPKIFAPAPSMITADQMQAEYLVDAAMADAKYRNNDIWLTQAVVSSCIPNSESDYITIGTSKVTITEIYNASRNDRDGVTYARSVDYIFVTLHSSRGGYQTGDVIEALGTCKGLQEQLVVIDIDWINKIGTGGAVAPPSGY
jgi:hypothetical protein